MQPFLLEKKEQIAELCRTHHVKRLAVFGSAVRSDFDEGRSDVDVLVEFQPIESVFTLVGHMKNLQHELELLFRRDVDLIQEGVIKNPYRLRSIERDKVMLYAA